MTFTGEETLLFFRQSATGHLAALLSTLLCEGRMRLCSPEPARVIHPIAITVLRELEIEIREFRVYRVAELEPRYRNIVFIAEDGFTARSRIDLPKGKVHEWHLPAAAVSDESHEVRITRARIVREMLLRRLDQWCAKRCRASAGRHARTA